MANVITMERSIAQRFLFEMCDIKLDRLLNKSNTRIAYIFETMLPSNVKVEILPDDKSVKGFESFDDAMKDTNDDTSQGIECASFDRHR